MHMYPTVTVERLASVTTATDDSDDMTIYEFDREPSMDVWWIFTCGGGTAPGSRYRPSSEVLAA
jgi:hypothetical protein